MRELLPGLIGGALILTSFLLGVFIGFKIGLIMNVEQLDQANEADRIEQGKQPNYKGMWR